MVLRPCRATIAYRVRFFLPSPRQGAVIGGGGMGRCARETGRDYPVGRQRWSNKIVAEGPFWCFMGNDDTSSDQSVIGVSRGNAQPAGPQAPFDRTFCMRSSPKLSYGCLQNSSISGIKNFYGRYSEVYPSHDREFHIAGLKGFGFADFLRT